MGSQGQDANMGNTDTNPPQATAMPALPGLTAEQLQSILGVLNASSGGTKKYSTPVDPPKDFSGRYGDSERFVRQCKMNFVANPHLFPTDQSKIAYILSFCKGGIAETFADALISKYFKDGWDTWDTFGEKFTAQFQQTNRKDQSLKNLTTIEMRNESADNYVARFRLLMQDAEQNDGFYDEKEKKFVPNDVAFLKQHFKRGLSHGMQEWLVNFPEPATLDELMTMIQQYDARRRAMNIPVRRSQFGWRPPQGGNQGWRPSQGGNQGWRKPQTTNENHYGEPMDLSALDIPKEEYQRRLTQGLCFNCGLGPHRARNCRQKQKKEAPQPNRNPFRQQKIAETKVEEAPVPLTAEEKAAQIAALLQGTNEENDQVKDILLKKGFH